MVVACLTLAGCHLGVSAVAPTAKKSAAPRGLGSASPHPPAATPVVGRVDAAVVQLTGKVKLISNHGGGLISDRGASVISNNGGTIVSDNAAGVIANNSAGYGLLAKVPESLLADAEISFVDASGKPLAGPDGVPLTARTDREGRYALHTVLGAGALVMRVKLWSGGELSAILVHDGKPGATQDVDTASSLGAAYVLDRYVRGDQAVLNKLPASEAQRLQREFEAARELLDAPPAYTAAGLVAGADDLRRKAPTVARTLADIEALLLGQAKLGDGRPATEVPLNRPATVFIDRAGDLVIGEYGMGRVRVVDRAGRMSTRVDATRGEIKTNFVRMSDVIEAPDGTMYVATVGDGKVRRVRRDGTVELVYADPAVSRYRPFTLALGPDGTLFIGGGEDRGNDPHLARLVAVSPAGEARVLPPIDAAPGIVRGLAVGPDGTLFVLRSGDPEGGQGMLHRVPPAGPAALIAEGLALGDRGDVTRTADGTLYVTEDQGGRIQRFAPDGTRTSLTTPTGENALLAAAGIAVAPSGALYVADYATGLVHLREPDGRWRVVAGVNSDTQASDGRAFPLNTPIAVAFDGQGRLLIAENGRQRVVRYADGRLETIAGTGKGFSGDGGPARAASFAGIAGLAARGDEIFVLDASNSRIRRIGPDGIVTTVVGSDATPRARLDDTTPAAKVDVQLAITLVLDPAGRPCWSNSGRHQVQRLGKPGFVDLVAGRKIPVSEPSSVEAMLADVLTDGESPQAATLRFPLGVAFDPQGQLHVSDSGHGLVRKVTGLDSAEPRISTVAGVGPAGLAAMLADVSRASLDGPAREIALVTPAGLCFDAAGNMYVGELGTTRTDLMADVFTEGAALDFTGYPAIPPRIRKITPDGHATTIAGPGGKFFTDPDAEDALVMPTALAISPDGRLVIADPGANLVRILPAGSF